MARHLRRGAGARQGARGKKDLGWVKAPALPSRTRANIDGAAQAAEPADGHALLCPSYARTMRAEMRVYGGQ